MLGYIKTYPDELTMREWRRYRAVYCGVCKRLGARHGAFERLAVSYDTTFMALFFLSFVEDEPEAERETCIAHPFNKRLIVKEEKILDFAAGLTCFLAYMTGVDDRMDGEIIKGRLVERFFKSGAHKFESEHPILVLNLSQILSESRDKEKSFQSLLRLNSEADLKTRMELAEQAANEIASDTGLCLALIFQEAAHLLEDNPFADEKMSHLLNLFGQNLGEWIYLMDAYEDKEKDQKANSFNPFAGLKQEEFSNLAPELLSRRIEVVDRTAALFPYYKDAGIVENILHLGLRSEMRRVRDRKAKQHKLELD